MVEVTDIPVQDIQPGMRPTEEVLELLDTNNNPLLLSEHLHYKIISEAGNILKEGTLTEGNTISLEGVKTRSFRLELDSLGVIDTECFDCLNLIKEQMDIDDDTESEEEYEIPDEEPSE